MRGQITKVVTSYGSAWGRVRPDNQPRDVFFSAECFEDGSDFGTLAIGQELEFEEEPDRANGMRAIHIKVINTANAQ